jgi:phosphoribosylanthranilate isomerase
MFVKICGTTSEEDALLAVALGADAVGFIFAPSSRQVSPSIARDIAKRLPREILTVGVFRDEAPQRVIDLIDFAGLKAAQLHGRETPEQTRWVRRRLPFVIQAFPAGDAAVVRARDYGADAILLDNPTPGSGRVFDWALASEAPSGQRVIIAGGLTTDNIGGAVAAVRPWGVDVVTGVEKAPGHKDPVKLRAFVAAARAAEVPPYEGGDDMPYDWQEEQFWLEDQ